MKSSSTPLTQYSSLRLRWLNFAASAGVVAFALVFHQVASQNRRILARDFTLGEWLFTGQQFLAVAASLYVAILGAFFLTEGSPGLSKSLRFWQVAWSAFRSPLEFWRAKLPRDDRVAVLATLLKALFGPLMTMALFTATMALLGNATWLMQMASATDSFRTLFDTHLYWFLFQLVVMADVFVFTLGYLVELPRLNNQIRSVDPTLLGWAAALVCYSPFNIVLGTLLGAPGSEFPQFQSPWLHYGLNALLLCLMAMYTSASVALGFKASNLTHRGIVGHGPYRWVRHPAYTCKNMAWWIGSIPIVNAAFASSAVDGLQALGSMLGWTLLYVLRAVTEEDHLRGVDEEYSTYAQKVRYRFIPGLC